MTITVEWYGTTARLDAPPGVLDQLPVPVRPRLHVSEVPGPDPDLSLAFVEGADGWELIIDDESSGVASLAVQWDRAWRHLELQMAARSEDPVFVHAGAVAIDGVGIVLPGRSGLGKTTLVLGLCRAGATYFSDEYALLDRQGRLHPYARDPHVRAGRSGRGEPTPLGEYTDRVGDGPVPVAGVLVARFEDGSAWAPVARSDRDCALVLLDNAVGARVRTPAVMDVVAAVAGSSWCAEGVRGDTVEVAEWVRKRIQGSES